ncbi:MAG: BlaI/MecI/CopY family transcriptional regulator [Planctomycetes bacterium]|nr:BlaI/MecI/CopY family transcriptional regulator [Planctomycetota bacterium]
MPNRLPTSRELEALKVLWEQGQATVRDIYVGMRSDEQDLAYTTVLSLVQTMEKKGLVSRKSEGRGKTHVYSAKIRSQPTLRKLAGQFVDRVFDGMVSQYVVSALESKQPSDHELDELERMIAEAKQKRTRKQQAANE